MTFATDYQQGVAYERFLKGLASMDRQLKGNGVKRSLTRLTFAPRMRMASQRLFRRSKALISCKASWSAWKRPADWVCGILEGRVPTVANRAD